MSRHHKIFSLLIMVTCSILVNSPQTLAYSYTGLKICTFYVDYRWGGQMIDIHRDAFQQAVKDWNQQQSKKSFRHHGPTASGVLDTYSSTKAEYGLTNITYEQDSKCVVAWASKLNQYRDTNTLKKARSTANHELGHTLGLDHTANTAIMNINRDRTWIYLPQYDDVRGVEALYPH